MCKCTSCGDEIPEGEVYGEWDDVCQECYEESEETEAA